MSLVLELPPDLEAELAAEAARLNLTLPEYALRLLAAGRVVGPQPRTGAELLAYWQGARLVGTRSDITDAAAYARKLRQRAEKRERS
jgi:hypothetical protein